MNTTQSWNAIYTRSNFEKKVSKLLSKKGIAHYYPENHLLINASNQKKSVTVSLFPSLIFVQVPENKPLSWLSQLSNVTNLVYWQQQPAVFPAVEIDLLRNFMEAHETVEATKTSLQSHNGNNVLHASDVHTFSADKTHTISLPSIGYTLSAKAETITNIKLVRKNNTRYRATDSLAFILGFKTSSR